MDGLYSIPYHNLWIPKMLEYNIFKDFNIRYIATSTEAKFTKVHHTIHGIPDLSIDELADRIYTSFKHVGVGNRPTILICHSMGGLLAKKLALRMQIDVNYPNNRVCIRISKVLLSSRLLISVLILSNQL
jgi:hypothetical protein